MSTHKTISFRLDAEKVEALDAVAEHRQRDRTFLLNEAVDAWLDLHHYQEQLVAAGMGDAQEGRYVDSAEMRKRLAKLKKKSG
jgi:RHH-type transcriptional regulator, rel operon repressor / antitoxin RelB